MPTVINGAVARIVLRYMIGVFTTWAMLSPEVGEELVRDPDMVLLVEAAIGAVMGAAVEGFYVLAKRWERFGWKT